MRDGNWQFLACCCAWSCAVAAGAVPAVSLTPCLHACSPPSSVGPLCCSRSRRAPRLCDVHAVLRIHGGRDGGERTLALAGTAALRRGEGSTRFPLPRPKSVLASFFSRPTACSVALPALPTSAGRGAAAAAVGGAGAARTPHPPCVPPSRCRLGPRCWQPTAPTEPASPTCPRSQTSWRRRARCVSLLCLYKQSEELACPGMCTRVLCTAGCNVCRLWLPPDLIFLYLPCPAYLRLQPIVCPPTHCMLCAGVHRGVRPVPAGPGAHQAAEGVQGDQQPQPVATVRPHWAGPPSVRAQGATVMGMLAGHLRLQDPRLRPSRPLTRPADVSP